jgi:hypothetical protein
VPVSKPSSLHQAKDTAFAAVLILLLFAQFWPMPDLVLAAMAVLLVAMVWPSFFGPAAKVWFGFSHVIGGVVSKVLLSIIYLVIATPIGLLRRVLGADSMRMRSWKSDRSSVFVERNQTFSAKDLETPY